MKANGWPDRRYEMGKYYHHYLLAVLEMARECYERGGLVREMKVPAFIGGPQHG